MNYYLPDVASKVSQSCGIGIEEAWEIVERAFRDRTLTGEPIFSLPYHDARISRDTGDVILRRKPCESFKPIFGHDIVTAFIKSLLNQTVNHKPSLQEASNKVIKNMEAILPAKGAAATLNKNPVLAWILGVCLHKFAPEGFTATGDEGHFHVASQLIKYAESHGIKHIKTDQQLSLWVKAAREQIEICTSDILDNKNVRKGIPENVGG